MFMIAIDLETTDLVIEQIFYTQTLGLPLRQATPNTFTVQAGTTSLTFHSSSQRQLLYHFAFTIPFNKFKQAKTWLTARTQLLKGEGKDEFEDTHMGTRNYYFSDPAGNILEFIAREDLPAKVGEGFAPEDILNISEIGLVVDDVPRIGKLLQRKLGIEVYRDSGDEHFVQLGDINGVFVLVSKGRLWVPEKRQPAMISPVQVNILGTLAQQITLESYPYKLTVAPVHLNTL